MKANEVPEKIIHNGIEYYRVDIIEDITIDGKTFVNKDAFIEKACKFLKSYRQEIYNGMGYIAGIVNDETIEDFRKYMEE